MAEDRSSPVTDTDADRALVAAVLAGDEAAVTALVERHHGVMTAVAAAILDEAAGAADVVQEAWMHVLAGLPEFQFRSSLRTWILRITSNVARTAAARRRRREVVAEQDAAELAATVDPARFYAIGHWREPPRPWFEGEQDAAIYERQLRVIVHREIEALPPNLRAVVRLRDVEELSSEETCGVLGISEANQRVLLHRGRARLRAAIERELGRP